VAIARQAASNFERSTDLRIRGADESERLHLIGLRHVLAQVDAGREKVASLEAMTGHGIRIT